MCELFCCTPIPLTFSDLARHVADQLREGKKVAPEQRDLVTIFFSDVVGFTTISSELPAIKVSEMLDRLYERFDELSRKHDVFKVETIGKEINLHLMTNILYCC